MAIWKDTKFDRYQVSSDGRVRSTNRVVVRSNGQLANYKGRILKILLSGLYPSVHLGRKNKQYMHRLLAEAFIPDPKGYPCVNHKDGDKHNNDLSNLEWCSHSENLKHAFRTGLKSNNNENSSQCKLSDDQIKEIRERVNAGEIQTSVSRDFSIDQSHVSNIANHKSRIL